MQKSSLLFSLRQCEIMGEAPSWQKGAAALLDLLHTSYFFTVYIAKCVDLRVFFLMSQYVRTTLSTLRLNPWAPEARKTSSDPDRESNL